MAIGLDIPKDMTGWVGGDFSELGSFPDREQGFSDYYLEFEKISKKLIEMESSYRFILGVYNEEPKYYPTSLPWLTPETPHQYESCNTVRRCSAKANQILSTTKPREMVEEIISTYTLLRNLGESEITPQHWQNRSQREHEFVIPLGENPTLSSYEEKATRLQLAGEAVRDRISPMFNGGKGKDVFNLNSQLSTIFGKNEAKHILSGATGLSFEELNFRLAIAAGTMEKGHGDTALYVLLQHARPKKLHGHRYYQPNNELLPQMPPAKHVYSNYTAAWAKNLGDSLEVNDSNKSFLTDGLAIIARGTSGPKAVKDLERYSKSTGTISQYEFTEYHDFVAPTARRLSLLNDVIQANTSSVKASELHEKILESIDSSNMTSPAMFNVLSLWDREANPPTKAPQSYGPAIGPGEADKSNQWWVRWGAPIGKTYIARTPDGDIQVRQVGKNYTPDPVSDKFLEAVIPRQDNIENLQAVIEYGQQFTTEDSGWASQVYGHGVQGFGQLFYPRSYFDWVTLGLSAGASAPKVAASGTRSAVAGWKSMYRNTDAAMPAWYRSSPYADSFLWRAIDPEEHADILKTKSLNVSRSAQMKQFAWSLDEAVDFANAFKLNTSASAVIGMQIPRSFVDRLGDVTWADPSIFRNGIVTFKDENLDALNKSGLIEVFDALEVLDKVGEKWPPGKVGKEWPAMIESK